MSNPYVDAMLYAEMHADYNEDLAYWEALALKAEGPVVELGCGSGRVSLHLASKKINVIGIDLERSMIEYAQTQALELGYKNAQFRVSDFTKDLLGLGTDLFIFPFNSICHITTPSDFKNFCAFIRKSLSDDGILAVHLFMPLFDFLEKGEALSPIASFYSQSKDLQFEVYEQNAYNRLTQMNEIDWYFEGDDDESEVLHQHLSLRVYFPQEIVSLFAKEGFDLVGIDGDYEQKPADSRSIALCLRFKKV